MNSTRQSGEANAIIDPAEKLSGEKKNNNKVPKEGRGNRDAMQGRIFQTPVIPPGNPFPIARQSTEIARTGLDITPDGLVLFQQSHNMQ